jgi:hypothetical protein
MTVIVQESVEIKLAGETEVLGENLPYWQFFINNSTWLEIGPPLCEVGD